MNRYRFDGLGAILRGILKYSNAFSHTRKIIKRLSIVINIFFVGIFKKKDLLGLLKLFFSSFVCLRFCTLRIKYIFNKIMCQVF